MRIGRALTFPRTQVVGAGQLPAFGRGGPSAPDVTGCSLAQIAELMGQLVDERLAGFRREVAEALPLPIPDMEEVADGEPHLAGPERLEARPSSGEQDESAGARRLRLEGALLSLDRSAASRFPEGSDCSNVMRRVLGVTQKGWVLERFVQGALEEAEWEYGREVVGLVEELNGKVKALLLHLHIQDQMGPETAENMADSTADASFFQSPETLQALRQASALTTMKGRAKGQAPLGPGAVKASSAKRVKPEGGASQPVSRQRNSGECFQCGSFGHQWAECPQNAGGGGRGSGGGRGWGFGGGAGRGAGGGRGGGGFGGRGIGRV